MTAAPFARFQPWRLVKRVTLSSRAGPLQMGDMEVAGLRLGTQKAVRPNCKSLGFLSSGRSETPCDLRGFGPFLLTAGRLSQTQWCRQRNSPVQIDWSKRTAAAP